MVDLKRLAGQSRAYQLRITYNVSEDMFYLSGYIGNESGLYERDGGPLQFKTIEEVIKHIQEFN